MECVYFVRGHLSELTRVSNQLGDELNVVDCSHQLKLYGYDEPVLCLYRRFLILRPGLISEKYPFSAKKIGTK